MTFLIFVSYMVQEKDKTLTQGSINAVLVLQVPSDFPKYMKQLEDQIKTIHSADVVVIQNITMQEWH